MPACAICAGCRSTICGSRGTIEHCTPLWLDGADDEENLAPAHIDCHARKTRDEAPVRAKSDRVRARYLGAHKTAQPMRGWRKFNGDVVINPKLRRLR